MHAGLPAALHRPHLFQVRGRDPLECTGNRRNTTNAWYHIRSKFPCTEFSAGLLDDGSADESVAWSQLHGNREPGVDERSLGLAAGLDGRLKTRPDYSSLVTLEHMGSC